MLGTVDVERGPIADLAVSTDGTTIVATHYGDGSVSIIDAYAMTVEADLDMPVVEPHMVVAGERRAYVTISGHQYDSVAVIDTEHKRVIANHPVGRHRDRTSRSARTAPGSSSARSERTSSASP